MTSPPFPDGHAEHEAMHPAEWNMDGWAQILRSTQHGHLVLEVDVPRKRMALLMKMFPGGTR